MSETSEAFIIRQEARRIASLAPGRAPETEQEALNKVRLDEFLALPATALNEAAVKNGMACSRHLFDEHEVEPSTDYRESFERLFHANHLVLPRIHGAFISDEMAHIYLSHADDYPSSNIAILPYRMLISKQGFAPGPAFVNGYVCKNITNCTYLDRKLIGLLSDHTLMEASKNEPERIPVLFWEILNRGDILSKMITEGYEYPYLTHQLVCASRSESPLKFYLDYFVTCDGIPWMKVEAACCIGFIKRYPIAEVMSLKLTTRQAESLASMYTVEELRPYVKKYPCLKAPLLHNALGL